MDNLYTWAALGTLAGASGLDYLIVSVTKEMRLPKKLGTRLWAVVVGSIILLCVIGALGQFNGWGMVLACFNGFLVGELAGRMNDSSIAAERQKIADQNDDEV